MPPARAALWLLLIGPLPPALLTAALLCAPGLAQALSGNPAVAWYLHTDPLQSALWFAGVYAVALYGLSLLLKNCSIMDASWSLLPASLYVLHFGFHPLSQPDPLRRLLVLIAVWSWSVRLTGNWLLKGGLGFEDFRYLRFRQTMPPALFQLFALVVLFVAQSGMVLAMSLPMYLALRRPGRPVGLLDAAALLITLGAVAIEAAADWQLRRFRALRDERMRARPEDLTGERPRFPRFLQTGLWRYSRHPNYFAEVTVWWGIYLFSVAATGAWINWTIIGPVIIHGLFIGGSTQLTEQHELRRKPEYAEYQRTTSRLIPWWPRPRRGGPAAS